MNENDKTVYQFKFVDRISAIKNLDDFMKSKDLYILTLRGEEGVGKSRLLKEYINEKLIQKKINYIYISNEYKSYDLYVSKLVQEIQMKKPKYFQDYMLKISPIIIDLISQGIFNISLQNVLETLGSRNVNVQQKQDMIYKLIKNMDSRVIILDNYDQIDALSKEILQTVIDKLIKEKKMKIILVLGHTAEKINQTHIYLSNHYPLEVEPLPQYIFFNEILENIISTSHIELELVKEIYELCHGNPQKLISLISESVYHSPSKSTEILDVYTLKEIVFENIVGKGKGKKNKIEEIVEENMYCKIIFLIFMIVDHPLSSASLIEITFIYSEIKPLLLKHSRVMESIKDDFNNALQLLINCNIVKKKNSNYFIQSHIIFDKINTLLNYGPEKIKMADTIIHYFSDLEEIFKKLDHLTKEEILLIKIKCLGICNNGHILKEMEPLLNEYNKKGQGIKKVRLYSYLRPMYLNCSPFFNSELISDILITYYTMGEYNLALEIVEKYSYRSFSFQYIKSKIYNSLLKKKQALETLNSINIGRLSDEKRTAIDHMKMLVLLEIPNQMDQSNKIFTIYYQKYLKSKVILNLYQALILINGFNFIEHSLAKECIKSSLKYLIDNNLRNRYDFYIGMTYHNLGAIIVRNENLDDAEFNFKKAICYLNKSRIHEVSYTYNDLAFIQINKSNFNQARKYLEIALVNCSSKYAMLAIKCNLLICYCETKNKNMSKLVHDELANFISTNNIKDPIVYRKIIMNLCYYELNYGLKEKAELLLKQLMDNVKNSSSAYRFNLWIDTYQLSIEKIYHPTPRKNDISAYQIFESWCITINHD